MIFISYDISIPGSNNTAATIEKVGKLMTMQSIFELQNSLVLQCTIF